MLILQLAAPKKLLKGGSSLIGRKSLLYIFETNKTPKIHQTGGAQTDPTRKDRRTEAVETFTRPRYGDKSGAVYAVDVTMDSTYVVTANADGHLE